MQKISTVLELDIGRPVRQFAPIEVGELVVANNALVRSGTVLRHLGEALSVIQDYEGGEEELAKTCKRLWESVRAAQVAEDDARKRIRAIVTPMLQSLGLELNASYEVSELTTRLNDECTFELRRLRFESYEVYCPDESKAIVRLNGCEVDTSGNVQKDMPARVLLWPDSRVLRRMAQTSQP